LLDVQKEVGCYLFVDEETNGLSFASELKGLGGLNGLNELVDMLNTMQ
jgi:hypothetical protein